ncbi:hypothetical protein TRICI_000715 [Trichomonascus ciferrii]|uniref:FAD-binding domain-containing protein n=1 Tax=Trichomonascus ciferrii TaxID=44093 RepID=A0A642VBA4_9ASCO|nr:hypothetical protein TRICI_000715 [Trichomonascus ciferrii]
MVQQETHFSCVAAQLAVNRFSQKEQQPERMRQIADEFTAKFRHAIESADAEEFNDLISDCGYWRDVVAFTNDYRAFTKVNVPQAASDCLQQAQAYGGEIDYQPKFSTLDDHAHIEFGIKFNNYIGPCVGFVHLVKDEDGQYRAQVLFTALDGVKDHPEQFRHNRAMGDKNSMLHYDEIRRREMENPDPTVLVVGGGHCGLMVAARLKYLGIRSLVIDRFERVGDNWRKRYGSLALHDTLYSQALPYMPWPETFPEFVSAGKFGNWLEHYVESMELNVWCRSTIVSDKTYFDENEQKWHVTVDRDGQQYNFVVTHLVMATGLSGGKPKMPKPFPGQETFVPGVIHSARHKGGAEWKGKNVLVMGTGSSGHDISLDLCNHGANVTMLQRSPTYVHSIKNGNIKTFNGDLMIEGVDLDYADRLTEATPKPIIKAVHQRLIPKIRELDKDLLEGLRKAGFQEYSGPDGSGFNFLSMERGGGFYFDSGACERIVNGDIKVKNGEIDHFTKYSVVFKDGSTMKPDLVIFCTGYTGFKESAIETLGEKYGKNLKIIWGLDGEGEINGLFRDCGIPKTYFSSGAIPLSRTNSKLIALQILAEQLGNFHDRYTIEKSKQTGNYVDLSSMLYQ